jgi:hypothetical protein
MPHVYFLETFFCSLATGLEGHPLWDSEGADVASDPSRACMFVHTLFLGWTDRRCQFAELVIDGDSIKIDVKRLECDCGPDYQVEVRGRWRTRVNVILLNYGTSSLKCRAP